MNKKINLLDLKEKELIDFFSLMGEEKYRAHQLMEWVYKRGVTSFEDMTNLSKSLREKLKQRAYISEIILMDKQVSKEDKSVKYLFQLEDGERIETVVMRYRYGLTICVSSQVGCRMGCRFCASGVGGRVRNLTAGEIMSQVLFVQNELRKKGSSLKGIVLMGLGEPLDNFGAVLDFLHLVDSPRGLNMSLRHVSLSTCGLVSKIRELAQYNFPLTLSVSLHAPDDVLRNKIMPINRKYPIGELIKACRYYADKTGQRITFDYILLDNFNTEKVYAYKLANLVKGLKFHINLIPFNPVRNLSFRSPSQAKVTEFKKVLEKFNIPVTVRRTLGTDIEAACGQLRRRSYRLSKGGDPDVGKRRNTYRTGKTK
ncbi:MAG: 23S rRNA (adenine(2503)-C(2))-methyltransferase RlmN [Firmicutes bacterium HGW-Firmicutes-13]|nr:MAG: 23S rRNA (adenine(2503)-C(2))-methyltransferase RlmN [Firmicutes bacterium HGW-Firmicutes-13]